MGTLQPETPTQRTLSLQLPLRVDKSHAAGKSSWPFWQSHITHGICTSPAQIHLAAALGGGHPAGSREPPARRSACAAALDKKEQVPQHAPGPHQHAEPAACGCCCQVRNTLATPSTVRGMEDTCWRIRLCCALVARALSSSWAGIKYSRNCMVLGECGPLGFLRLAWLRAGGSSGGT